MSKKISFKSIGPYALILLIAGSTGCNTSTGSPSTDKLDGGKEATTEKKVAGKDYIEFSRVKIMDDHAFTEPEEAYSILLPNGWSSKGAVFWTAPGRACAGTNMRFSAESADGRTSFQILPVAIWSWSDQPQMLEINRQYNTSEFCTVSEPTDATTYLKNVWAKELGDVTITDIKPNDEVVQTMSESDEKAKQEMMRYGASQVNYKHSAITAHIKMKNGKNGIVMCGVTNIETVIPNMYDGTYSTAYTNYSTRMLFTFPEEETASAEKMMTVIVAGFRTNPDWKKATDNYWRDVREKKQQENIGRIRMIDERTRQIGRQAIENGNRRLADMDNQMRSWEAQQSSEDRMHTNFIKTIREVENYRDETGKVELSSGYDHAWSRSDGNHFIMTNDPNFDPSSVLQDQQWKEMKKVD